MNMLELRDIVFEPVAGRRILDGLTLEIARGEIHALLGANGTGKSTLSALIMGLEGYSPQGGTIIFDGADITTLRLHERARQGITLAWQEPVRFEGITVRDYLSLNAHGRKPDECLITVGMSPERYLDRQADRTLSGGERKRIELASVLALSPRLTLLDEPDSGIDMLSIHDVMDVIRAFRQGEASVFLITHREEIANMADRASLLCSGRIICSGAPAKVAEFYRTQRCLTCTTRECVYV